MILPSIDLYNGKAVQLRQGRVPVIEREDVMDLLTTFSIYGEVAVVDLNAAFGEGDNTALIVEMAKKVPIRVGGGIRNLKTAQNYLKAGVTRVVIGTSAREDWLSRLPKDQIVIALDAWGDQWMTEGWRTSTSYSSDEVLKDLSSKCSEFLYTQIEKEGMMQGIDQERFQKISKLSPIPITFAGGITTVEDIKFIRDLGAKAQIGMAVYTGKLNLMDCFMDQLDFEKQALIPTIVQDSISKEILMLAYSSPESTRLAITGKKGIYYSRSRQELWEKGATSGHTQKLVKIEADCDGDTLIFQVEQKGPACHFNRYSCFPKTTNEFDIRDLNELLISRKVQLPKDSYTTKLYEDPQLLDAKLREEVEELIEAKTHSEVRWEAADLLYFTMVQAISKGVEWHDIVNELRCRNAG